MPPAKYAITQQDQLAFNILHWRGTVPRALFYVTLVVAGMIALAFAFDGMEGAIPVAVGGVVGVAVMLTLARYILVPRHAKRAWREFALIKEPVELSFTDDGFTLLQPSAHVDARWEKMIAWDEDAQVFAIYVTRQQAYILPKAQLDDAVIDFARERLIATGLVQKGAKRK